MVSGQHGDHGAAAPKIVEEVPDHVKENVIILHQQMEESNVLGPLRKNHPAILKNVTVQMDGQR